MKYNSLDICSIKSVSYSEAESKYIFHAVIKSAHPIPLGKITYPKDIYFIIAQRAKCSRALAKHIAHHFYYRNKPCTIWQIIQRCKLMKAMFMAGDA